jgi:nicotinate-nucleotide adenylyltransferase
MSALGVLGGTFDPVHNGHLRMAMELRDLLSLDAVRLVPVGLPAHRDPPTASASARRALLDAAVSGIDGLCVDDRELQRDGPCYTVDTLRAMREEEGDTPLCLIIGMDQFEALSSWHEWRSILDLAHLCVVHRPGIIIPQHGEVAEVLAERQVTGPGRLHERPAGYIFVGALPVLDISSTRIRALLSRRQDPSFLLPQAVLNIIHAERIYDE